LSYGDPVGEFDDQVVLRPKKGTLVLLHGHTWHRVLPITGSYRFSTNYRSAPKDTPDDITDICVYRNMRYRFSTARRHYGYLRLSKHALPVLDLERRRGTHRLELGPDQVHVLLEAQACRQRHDFRL
jgi:hypothetical protein